ncbi:MAG: hypothetical protein KBD78_06985 [Oligoflexales bacterium]|nr:hypothetical protein [Oligoflexales bacterium]
MKLRKICDILSFLCIFCWLDICALGDQLIAAETQNALNVAVIGENRLELDPLLHAKPNMSFSTYMLHRPIIMLSEDGLPLCELCKEIPSFENDQLEFVIQNTDKLIVSHWQLREGLKWGDGSPITALDFFAVWELLRSGQLFQKESLLLKIVREIQIYPEQPLKMTITFYRDQFDLNALINFFPVPFSILQEFLKSDVVAKSGAYNLSSPFLKNPYNAGLYSGPFVLNQISSKSLQLKRNPHFYGNKPDFEQVVLNQFTSSDKLEDFGKYLFVDLSWFDAIGAQGLQNKMSLKNKKMLLSARFWPSLYTVIWFNPSRTNIYDSQLVEAISNSINRQELLKKSGLDAYSPIYGIDFFRQARKMNISPDFNKKNIEGRELIRKLLREFEEKSELNINRKKDTSHIDWVLGYNEKNLEGKKIAEALQIQLLKYGIKVSLKAISPEIYYKPDALKEIDLLIVNQLKQPGDSIAEHFGLGDLNISDLPTNIFVPWRWRDEGAMQLMALLQNEHRAVKKEEYWQKFLEIFKEKAPFIPLFFKSRFALYSNELQFKAAINADLPLSVKIEDWKM